MMVGSVGLWNDIVLFEQGKKMTWSGINVLLQDTVSLLGVADC